jgi:RNA polymerase sigma factor (TIGR02999 family)
LNQNPTVDACANALLNDADFTSMYEALKKIARRQRREKHDTLNTTALVHELYLQLRPRESLNFQSDRQFYSYAAQAMRHLLVDRARARAAERRGGELQMVSMQDAEKEAVAVQLHSIELDQALAQLALREPRAYEVFCLIFFAGLSNQRAAELLNISTRTIDRDWLYARAWVQARIELSPA